MVLEGVGCGWSLPGNGTMESLMRTMDLVRTAISVGDYHVNAITQVQLIYDRSFPTPTDQKDNFIHPSWQPSLVFTSSTSSFQKHVTTTSCIHARQAMATTIAKNCKHAGCKKMRQFCLQPHQKILAFFATHVASNNAHCGD